MARNSATMGHNNMHNILIGDETFAQFKCKHLNG